jgi:hypothetical protein
MDAKLVLAVSIAVAGLLFGLLWDLFGHRQPSE